MNSHMKNCPEKPEAPFMHVTIGGAQCGICDQMFLSQEDLGIHWRTSAKCASSGRHSLPKDPPPTCGLHSLETVDETPFDCSESEDTNPNEDSVEIIDSPSPERTLSSNSHEDLILPSGLDGGSTVPTVYPVECFKHGPIDIEPSPFSPLEREITNIDSSHETNVMDVSINSPDQISGSNLAVNQPDKVINGHEETESHSPRVDVVNNHSTGSHMDVESHIESNVPSGNNVSKSSAEDVEEGHVTRDKTKQPESVEDIVLVSPESTENEKRENNSIPIQDSLQDSYSKAKSVSPSDNDHDFCELPSPTDIDNSEGVVESISVPAIMGVQTMSFNEFASLKDDVNLDAFAEDLPLDSMDIFARFSKTHPPNDKHSNTSHCRATSVDESVGCSALSDTGVIGGSRSVALTENSPQIGQNNPASSQTTMDADSTSIQTPTTPGKQPFIKLERFDHQDSSPLSKRRQSHVVKIENTEFIEMSQCMIPLHKIKREDIDADHDRETNSSLQELGHTSQSPSKSSRGVVGKSSAECHSATKTGNPVLLPRVSLKRLDVTSPQSPSTSKVKTPVKRMNADMHCLKSSVQGRPDGNGATTTIGGKADDDVSKDYLKRPLLHCSKCKMPFLKKCGLQNHIRFCKSKTSKGDYLQCAKCGFHFANLGRLKVHLRECSGDLCNSNADLDNTVESSIGQQLFPCIKCKKGFGSKGGLTIHSRMCQKSHFVNVKQSGSSATSEKALESKTTKAQGKYECGLCHSVFDSIQDLADHHGNCEDPLTTTEKNDHKCTICMQAFTSKTMLEEHFTATHQLTTCFRCKTCYVSFMTALDITSHHMEMHTEQVSTFTGEKNSKMADDLSGQVSEVNSLVKTIIDDMFSGAPPPKKKRQRRVGIKKKFISKPSSQIVTETADMNTLVEQFASTIEPISTNTTDGTLNAENDKQPKRKRARLDDSSMVDHPPPLDGVTTVQMIESTSCVEKYFDQPIASNYGNKRKPKGSKGKTRAKPRRKTGVITKKNVVASATGKDSCAKPRRNSGVITKRNVAASTTRKDSFYLSKCPKCYCYFAKSPVCVAHTCMPTASHRTHLDTCAYCNISFLSQDIREHVRFCSRKNLRERTVSGFIRCKWCSFFGKRAELDNHELNCDGSQAAKTCSLCHLKFFSHENLKQHVALNHVVPESTLSSTSFVCGMCDMNFKTNEEMVLHMSTSCESTKLTQYRFVL